MPTGAISTHESGVDLVVEWRIENFSTLRDGEDYWSPAFFIRDVRLWLEIFPSGSTRRNSSGHVDLSLKKSSYGPPVWLSFSLSLKTAKGERYKEEHVAKIFGFSSCSYEVNRFIPRAELSRRRADLLPDDVLTVVCILKRSTSARNDPIWTADWTAIQDVKEIVELFSRDGQRRTEKLENICVETSIQTEEEIAEKLENIYVETSTQTAKEIAEKSVNICVETSTQTEKEIENSENICVETSTQTEKETAKKSVNICVETSTQTEKEIGEGFEYIFVVTSAQTGKVNAENDPEQNSENTSVEPCTQMDEKSENSKRIYVNASTQTGEENEERDWMTDVLDFLKAGNGIDVTFEVETPNGHVEFFAHKLILAMKSPFFADEFYGEGKTDAHLVIPLKGINPKAFMEMLRYCYDNKPRMRTIEEACVLFKVASDFKILNLQKLCHTFIKDAKLDP